MIDDPLKKKLVSAEPEAIGLPSPSILRYKGLLSQLAPVAAKTSGTVTVGMLWTVTTFEAGDDFSNWTLVSGTGNTSGDVYQATTTAPTVWTNGSSLDYTGEPFIVSLDSDDVLNPTENSFGEDLTFAYTSAGLFTCVSAGTNFTAGKTSFSISNSGKAKQFGCEWTDTGTLTLSSWIADGTATDALMVNVPFMIEVAP